MATATKTSGVYFKCDDDTKKSFSELCDEIGISVSSALTLIMKSSVRNKSIPVELKTYSQPASISDISREEFIKMIDDSNAEFEKGNYKGEKELLEQIENLK